MESRLDRVKLIYEYWRGQHDKWYGRLLNSDKEYPYKKWKRAYDKMFKAKELLTQLSKK